MDIVGPLADSDSLKMGLNYWTATFSDHPVNHFYVGRTRSADSIQALIYWKEERTLIEYRGLTEASDEPLALSLAFGHSLKLDRDTVDSDAEIGGSTYVITHRRWVDDMEKCLSLGSAYTISLEEAKRAILVAK